mmetsp:Transcript_10887/g.19902  ORF Transcript_10887/g.19902 Transcript_10887/m.19902 type:complete len:108 (-) Transcript_10887:61-384(-)
MSWVPRPNQMLRPGRSAKNEEREREKRPERESTTISCPISKHRPGFEAQERDASTEPTSIETNSIDSSKTAILLIYSWDVRVMNEHFLISLILPRSNLATDSLGHMT